MREHAPCGACGADDAFLLFTTPDTRNPSSGEIFPVGRCRRCGHAYVLDRPPVSEIGRYYPADYNEHRKTEAPSERKHSKRHRRVVLSPGQRVLDVGCGSGYDLLRLRDRGAALYGIELNPDAAAQARSNGITVFAGPADRADFPDAHFHQVTMNHCLEHFHDPLAALRNIRRMTHPEGSIHLTFPTAEGANFRVFRRHWHHLDVPRHLHFFTHASFVRLTRAATLRIVHRACTSGTRGFRRSLGAVSGLDRVVKTPPLWWIVKAGLKLADGLRQGDVAEYVLRPG
ncbi:MAG TPA: class I SAM-dependent methyltransferase [Planctomycetota bacterium]|nr:class I SAM-dependent methyltransferase [Planctomycetota bacterium]